jgi:hypothetical protein
MSKVTLDSGSVDKLGVLLAQIADLTKQADAIKDAIKEAGVSIEGSLFKATYVESDRKVFDKDCYIKANSQAAYDSYLKVSAVFSVKVTSR